MINLLFFHASVYYDLCYCTILFMVDIFGILKLPKISTMNKIVFSREGKFTCLVSVCEHMKNNI